MSRDLQEEITLDNFENKNVSVFYSDDIMKCT